MASLGPIVLGLGLSLRSISIHISSSFVALPQLLCGQLLGETLWMQMLTSHRELQAPCIFGSYIFLPPPPQCSLRAVAVRVGLCLDWLGQGFTTVHFDCLLFFGTVSDGLNVKFSQ